jgi:hypothetical protein
MALLDWMSRSSAVTQSALVFLGTLADVKGGLLAAPDESFFADFGDSNQQ